MLFYKAVFNDNTLCYRQHPYFFHLIPLYLNPNIHYWEVPLYIYVYGYISNFQIPLTFPFSICILSQCKLKNFNKCWISNIQDHFKLPHDLLAFNTRFEKICKIDVIEYVVRMFIKNTPTPVKQKWKAAQHHPHPHSRHVEQSNEMNAVAHWRIDVLDAKRKWDHKKYILIEQVGKEYFTTQFMIEKTTEVVFKVIFCGGGNFNKKTVNFRKLSFSCVWICNERTCWTSACGCWTISI